MSENRMIEAAKVAGFKSKIIAPAYDDDRRANLRKQQQKAGIGLIFDLQEAVFTAIQPVRLQVEQSREIVRQLLQIVGQAKIIQITDISEVDALAGQIWNICSNHDQLKPLAVQLRALLSSDDILWLLTEELEPAHFIVAVE